MKYSSKYGGICRNFDFLTIFVKLAQMLHIVWRSKIRE